LSINQSSIADVQESQKNFIRISKNSKGILHKVLYIKKKINLKWPDFEQGGNLTNIYRNLKRIQKKKSLVLHFFLNKSHPQKNPKES